MTCPVSTSRAPDGPFGCLPEGASQGLVVRRVEGEAVVPATPANACPRSGQDADIFVSSLLAQ